MKRWNAGLCNTTPRFKLLRHKLAKFQKEGLPILDLTLRQAVSDIIIFSPTHLLVDTLRVILEGRRIGGQGGGGWGKVSSLLYHAR